MRQAVPAGEELDRIRAAQMRSLYRGAPAAVLIAGGFALSFVVTTVLADGIFRAGWLVWLAGIVTSTAARLLLSACYTRDDRADARWPVWARRTVMCSLLESAVWGSGGIMFGSSGLPDHSVFLFDLMLAGIAVGGLPAYGIYPAAYYAFVLPPWIALSIWTGLQPGPFQRSLVVYYACGASAVALLARRGFGNVIIESLRLRFENADLLASLRIEKDRADQALVTKSRFLAAASHDLRQPVHAFGLFVSALEQRVSDPGLRRLIEHARGSVDAMDRLFAALLDISRLDANIVEVHARGFPIQPLLERLCRDYAAEAAAKGVRLVLHPCTLAVTTDPVLLERILRNLIANAVRYTERGRIVVGCRRGPRLRIAVLDTGPGIPVAEQERVFEEFHQLGNPERDREKGLGLGLAIVRRLSVLLDVPLTLRSAPGRGTAVTVAVPRAAAMSAAEPDARPPTTTTGGLVLVIDDEAAIREGTCAVLGGWGHEVVAAATGAEAARWAAADRRRPALILCDFRLPDDEDGIKVIRSLRDCWSEAVPAILITGDTGPDRLTEARASGLLLLHKPLALGKLRAAMAALMEPASSPGLMCGEGPLRAGTREAESLASRRGFEPLLPP